MHGWGWKPSPPDFRDLRADPSGLKVAETVDPRDELPAVYDQGNLGSCTSNAVCAALQYDRMLDGHPTTANPSRLFVYYCERLLEGVIGQGDTGAYGRDGFKAAQHWGVCTEKDWPYDIERFEDDPPDDLWRHATHHKLTKQYRAVDRSVSAFKQVLSNRQTIAFGFSVYESFETRDVSDYGIVPLPEWGEAFLGGHEMLIVGYLADEPQHALVRNSWSNAWGLNGYCLFPWAYLMDTNLADDFRTILRPA